MKLSNAGSDQVVTLPAIVNLDGTVSDDGIVAITWSKVSGPGTVTFGNANAVDTTAAFSVSGVYVLRLTVDSHSDDVTVIVNAAVPVGDITPAQHGVIAGAGQPLAIRQSNFSNMLLAVASATSQNKTLRLPADTIELEVPSTSKSGIRLKGGKTLVAVGAGVSSRLQFFPDSPTYDYKGFTLDPKASLSLKDLIVVGPTNPGPSGEYNKITNAINQSGQSSNASGPVYDNPYFVKLERVGIEGEWYTSIQGGSGDGPLELIDCDITGYTQCVAWQATFNGGKSFIAKNTRFHDAGLPGKGHLVYLSKPVAMNIDNCTFAGNYRLAIHHYGSGTIPPAYAILQNSTIEDTCADGIETANVAKTTIKNCTFNNPKRAVALTGNTDIEDCVFNGSGIHTYDNHSNVTVNIRRSRFARGEIITSVWKNCVWNIEDCEFDNAQTAIGNSATGTQMVIERCRFKGTIGRGVVMYDGQTQVRNSIFEGSYTEAAVIIEAPVTSAATLLVDTCTFSGTGRQVWTKKAPPGAVTIQ